MWDPVTKNMIAKNWSEATKQKQIIEQVSTRLKREGEKLYAIWILIRWGGRCHRNNVIERLS